MKTCGACGIEVGVGKRLCDECSRAVAEYEVKKGYEIIADAVVIGTNIENTGVDEYGYNNITSHEVLPGRYLTALFVGLRLPPEFQEERAEVAMMLLKAICEDYHQEALKEAEAATNEVENFFKDAQ